MYIHNICHVVQERNHKKAKERQHNLIQCIYKYPFRMTTKQTPKVQPKNDTCIDKNN